MKSKGAGPMSISFAKVQVLNPSRVTRRLLWHVLSIGVVSRDEPEEHAGMDKAGLFLFRVKSGHGALEVQNEKHALKPGATWWLLDLARARRYVPRERSRLVTLGVRFSGPGIDSWREEAFGGRACFALSSTSHAMRLRRATDALLRLSPRRSPEAEWRMNEILVGVLGVVLESRDMPDAAPPGAHSPTRRVIEAVQSNPARDWRATELSTLAGISYSSLRTHFKASQGETLHDYLQRTRLEQARSRLTNMQSSVKEIARQLNFSSEFYFSRWFHHAAGMSPSKFRALIRG
jgi:AraC-like DNA-binding protein